MKMPFLLEYEVFDWENIEFLDLFQFYLIYQKVI